ncbi:Derlin-2 [Thelohanellus kitauei]|uniref:Derlin n=1 Tax=Thelohanellus kitauei TaxID=669202 RepID=A0A0C2JA39_THEKT|nr:Derlin-2 [Thelohanellus kitauei]
MDFDHLSRLYLSIPPVTRIILTCFTVASLLTHFELVRTFKIYLDFHLIFYRFQIWRIFTCFMYLGQFSVVLFFNLLIFFRHSSQLEVSQYYGRTADFVMMYLFCFFVLLSFGFALKEPFLGHSLIETVIYVWSRKNPHALVNLLGIFTFPAPWFPYISLFVSFITKADIKMDLASLFTGHLYFYLEEIYPSRYDGRVLIKAPKFLENFVDYLMSRGRQQDGEEVPEEDQVEPQWNL